MKKGLLSILAASAVLVGCQNYDDQFDALNTQITQLKSTVDGLAGVQGEVTALKGLITNLQGSIGEVASANSALQSDLASVLEEVEAIDQAVQDVASGEDLAQVQSDLDGVSSDVTDILESNNVYSQDVIVDSKGTLDFAVALGSKLSIVNGNVVFVVDTTMDIDKVQEALDAVGIVVGEFAYLAKSSTVSPVNFDNISATADLEVAQAGSYSFAALTSAKNVKLGSNYNSKVTGVNMPLLETVTSFTTGSVAEVSGGTGAGRVNGPAVNNKISFTKATSIDINTLKRYGTSLELGVDEGGTIGIAALDDVDATGAQSNLTLTLEGPSKIEITKIKDGAMTFKNVEEVIVNGFEGPFTLQAGVVKFKADKAMSVATASATDLEEFEITGITDPDDATDKEGPAVSFDGNSNIRIVKLKGKIDSVTLNNNSSLEEAHTTADVSGHITISNNSDLVAVNTAGSKASGVTVENNNDLETLDISTETVDTTEDTDTKVDGTYIVKNNASLGSVVISSKKVKVLEITGNDDMTSIDISGMTTLGDTTTGRSMKIFNNDLTATRATDSDDTKAAGKAGDEGSYSETAGMKTAKALAKKMDGDAKAVAYVYFDTVETFDPEGSSVETNDHTFVTTAVSGGVPTFASQPQQIVVLHKDASNATTTKPAIAAKRAYILTGIGDASDVINITTNAADLDGTTGIDLSSANDAVNVSAILATAVTTKATAAGVTLGATANASPTVTIRFGVNDNSMENSVTAATTITPTAFTLTASDVITLTMAGDKAAEVSGAYTTASDFVDAMINAWNTANSDANLTQWVVSSPTTDTIMFRAKDTGTSQIGKKLTVGGSGVASWALSNFGYEIYNGYEGDPATPTATDNGAKGNAIVLTIESTTLGASLGETGQIGATAGTGLRETTVAGTGVTVTELDNTYRKNLTISTETDKITATNEYPSQARSDVRAGEDEILGGGNTATDFDRVSWLAD
ncbi:MAG: hypothetical protein ACON47_10070 [Flavobacteriaceae bacterium]